MRLGPLGKRAIGLVSDCLIFCKWDFHSSSGSHKVIFCLGWLLVHWCFANNSFCHYFHFFKTNISNFWGKIMFRCGFRQVNSGLTSKSGELVVIVELGIDFAHPAQVLGLWLYFTKPAWFMINMESLPSVFTIQAPVFFSSSNCMSFPPPFPNMINCHTKCSGSVWTILWHRTWVVHRDMIKKYSSPIRAFCKLCRCFL